MAKSFSSTKGLPSRNRIVVIVLCIGALFAINHLVFNSTDVRMTTLNEKNVTSINNNIDFELQCSAMNSSKTCPQNYYPNKHISQQNGSSICPDYFQWIYEDLLPWRETGISKEMVDQSARKGHFRLVIVAGKVYVQSYRNAYQTRIPFTLWGFVQLLRRYPGKIPDLELVFECDDWPVIPKKNDAAAPPPVFRYCGDGHSVNIVFPDWSFWGGESRPEVNIKPWDMALSDLKEANKLSQWLEREPYAYWKGAAWTGVPTSRADLMKCNVTPEHDWGARLYDQVWKNEVAQGFKQSNLSSQCNHRYKIYIEGNTWSVSDKYILACDSPTLYIKSRYFDFFSRSLKPLKHFWPVDYDDKCKSIKFAVEWGNSHHKEAQEIGRNGSRFIFDELTMDHVYDYMFHSLKEYAKLLKYKPEVPKDAVEICSESIACSAQGLMRKYLEDSLVKHPHISNPCTMPPPYSPSSLQSLIKIQENGEQQVQRWKEEYWKNQGTEAKES